MYSARRADDVEVAVLIAVLHLEGLLHLRHDFLEQRGVALERAPVVHAEDGAVGDPDAAEARLTGVDAEHVGAQRGDPVLHRLLRAAAKGHHGDDRAHADDDAEHGEHRPQRVGLDRLVGRRHRLTDLHLSARRRPAPAAALEPPAPCCCCTPGSPPPPVIRFIRSRASSCDCTRLWLGRISTESVGSRPLTTSLRSRSVSPVCTQTGLAPPGRFTKTM